MQEKKANAPDKPLASSVRLVGINVARLRAEVNWSTRAFAQHTGLSLSFLYRIEHTKHKTLSVDTLERIARGFGVHVSLLVSPSSAKKAPFPDTPTRELVALSLASLREARGWTQEELARQSGVDRSLIADVERRARNVSLNVLERLALSLDVPVQLLLSNST